MFSFNPLSSANSLSPSKDDDSKGYYISATIIEAKDPKAPTMTEEIFGPVGVVIKFKDEAGQFRSLLYIPSGC